MLPAVPISIAQDPCLESWRTGQPCDIKDFLFIECLAQQQGFDERVELLAMRVQECDSARDRPGCLRGHNSKFQLVVTTRSAGTPQHLAALVV